MSFAGFPSVLIHGLDGPLAVAKLLKRSSAPDAPVIEGTVFWQICGSAVASGSASYMLKLLALAGEGAISDQERTSKWNFTRPKFFFHQGAALDNRGRSTLNWACAQGYPW
jgi:hypothetical protein